MSDKVLEGMRLVFEGFKEKYGIDIEDENFKETPERVTRAYDEFFRGCNTSDKEVEQILTKTFPTDNDEMVTITGIKTHSNCPHHLQVVEIECDLAYIPKERAIGLSKLNRIVHLLAKRPVLQEQLTHDIASYLEKYLEPRGVMVKIKGKHNCVAARGVKDPDSRTITTSVRGVFRDPSEKAREEFLMLISSCK